MLNPYVMKILISAREEDSINSIASRIGLSYGWTYKWISELIKIRVFKATRMKLYLQKNSTFYKRALKFIKDNFSQDISFHYSVIGLFGIPYSFTEIDSVFIWTKGGYNISRYKGHYPIFIKIRKKDHSLFCYYTDKLGLGNNQGVYYKVKFVEEIKSSFVDDIPVDPLDETVEYMKRYIYNFQPALEMVKEMYDKRIGIKYKEAVVNV